MRHESQREQVRQFGDVVVGNLCGRTVADQAVQGADTVVHLAANPSPDAQWDSLQHDNIEATHNLFEAAADAGCRRIVFASSIQFAIFHALSNNLFSRMDIGSAVDLVGYAPEDDFTELNQRLAGLNLRNEVTPHDARHRDGARA